MVKCEREGREETERRGGKGKEREGREEKEMRGGREWGGLN